MCKSTKNWTGLQHYNICFAVFLQDFSTFGTYNSDWKIEDSLCVLQCCWLASFQKFSSVARCNNFGETQIGNDYANDRVLKNLLSIFGASFLKRASQSEKWILNRLLTPPSSSPQPTRSRDNILLENKIQASRFCSARGIIRLRKIFLASSQRKRGIHLKRLVFIVLYLNAIVKKKLVKFIRLKFWIKLIEF